MGNNYNKYKEERKGVKEHVLATKINREMIQKTKWKASIKVIKNYFTKY